MDNLIKLADLISHRNQVNLEISKIIGRPALPGHIGEYIASKIFNIKLEDSAVTKGIDGIFTKGPLTGKTVNIKLYGKQEGLLDITLKNLADYYLVLTGAKSPAISSRGRSRPVVISQVYLFEMTQLIRKLRKRGVKIGIATSVVNLFWKEAEIYLSQINNIFILSNEERNVIGLFKEKKILG